MRIATFNVNGIKARLPRLIDWLEETRPDVACLQELKTADETFPVETLHDAGYRALWHGQKSFNGVALLARIDADAPLVERQRGLPDLHPDAPEDTHSRYLEAEVGGLIVATLYLPNGNPQPGPKFDYKLAWMARLSAHARALMESERPVILAGDYNVIPTDRDLSSPQSMANDALMQPESRSAYRRLLAQGWTDALACLNPDGGPWTFWDYQAGCWPRDEGLRIDHLLLSPPVADRLLDAGVDRAARAQEKASDHAPVWITLRDTGLAQPLGRA